MKPHESPPVRWHAQSADQVCVGLEADPVQGLPAEEAVRRLARHGRNRLAEDLAGRWQIEVTPLLTAGQAHREISRAAGKSGVDLVVVGAMGEHPAREFFLGSTAERVVRESPVPVLVVRNEGREPYSRVLAALGLSPHSPTVAELARRVAAAAHLTLGHAFEVPFEGETAIRRGQRGGNRALPPGRTRACPGGQGVFPCKDVS